MNIIEIENNRDILVKNWFLNVCNGRTNDTVLLLFDATDFFIKDLEKQLKPYNQTFSLINNHLKMFENKLGSDINIILNISSEKLIKNEEYVKDLYYLFSKTTFLFVHEESNLFSNELEFYLSGTLTSYDTYTVKKNQRHLFYLELIEPYKLIKNCSASELKNILKFNVKYGFISLFKNMKYTYLIDQLNIEDAHSFDNIYSDLKMLDSSKILTSRLAVVIYRSTLNIKATTTAIGRYFHKKTGSKSKTIKVNNPNIKIQSNDLIDKGYYKAYDLSVNESEILIRKEIAEKLISLDLKSLNAVAISTVTKLPIDDVEKMINKM